MRSYIRQLIRWGMGVVAGITLVGCAGTLKVPLSQASHIRLEAVPFEEHIGISYHRYEVLKNDVHDGKWSAEVEVEWVGVIYESDSDYSPAAQKLELGWEKLWEDGTPNWHTVVRLLEDKELEAAYREVQTDVKPKQRPTIVLPSEEEWRRIDHASADWHLFMFATPVGW